MTFSESNNTRNKGVLRSSINKGLSLKDSSDGEESRGRNFRVGRFDRGQEVVRRVVDTRNNIAVPLGVRSPKDNNSVKTIVILELANIGANVLEMSLFVVSRDEVISASLLVGGDEIRIVDGWERLPEEGHVRSDLPLQVIVENLSTFHGLVHRDTGNVPTTENEIVGMDHGEDVRDGNVNVLSRGRIVTDTNSRGPENRTNVVGLLDTLLSAPDNVVTVGKDGSTKSGTIIAADTNHHQSGLGWSAFSLKLVRLYSRIDNVLAV
jgi:hypothetical protein